MSQVRNVQVGHFSDHYLVVPADSDEEALVKAREILGDWLSPTSNLEVVKVRDHHETVGQPFRAPFFSDHKECTCIAYDWRTGFWMEFQDGQRRDVSERAIGRTYHRIYKDEVKDVS